jgi:uncharacterized delta-60 repeat protein
MKKISLYILILSATLVNAQVNGTLDLTFNTTGYNLININGNDNAQALVINSDSSILIAGSTGTTGNLNIGVKKIFPNGTPDSNFGTSGSFTFDFAGFSDFCYDIAVQSDGKIILVGAAGITAANPDFLAIRLNADGSIDSTFGNQGIVKIEINTGEDYAKSLVIQPDGKIVLAGYSNTPGFSFKNAALLRLNSDGSLDTTFGTAGISILPVSLATEDIESIVQISNGDFRAVGKGGTTSIQNMIIYGILNNGNIDTSFGTNGYISNTSLEFAYDIKERFNQLYIAGKVSSSGGIYVTDINGTPNATFGNNGLAIGNLNADLAYLTIQVLQDSTIVVGGSTTISFLVRDMVVAEYNADGTINADFGTSGNAIINTGGFEDANDIAIQQDGKIVGAGLSSQGSGNDMVVFRLENQIITSSLNATKKNLSVYPNPIIANEISILNNGNKNLPYQLIDLNGKLIQTGSTDEKIEFKNNLDHGIYLLKILSNGQELRFKIVK